MAQEKPLKTYMCICVCVCVCVCFRHIEEGLLRLIGDLATSKHITKTVYLFQYNKTKHTTLHLFYRWPIKCTDKNPLAET